MGALIGSLFLGLVSVLQVGSNKELGKQWGLAASVFVSAVIVTVISGILLIWVMKRPDQFPTFFSGKFTTQVNFWHVTAGIWGFCIVAGLPFLVYKFGAYKVFLAFIATQMIGSMVWDVVFEQIPVTGTRVTGAFLAILGAVLVSFEK